MEKIFFFLFPIFFISLLLWNMFEVYNKFKRSINSLNITLKHLGKVFDLKYYKGNLISKPFISGKINGYKFSLRIHYNKDSIKGVNVFLEQSLPIKTLVGLYSAGYTGNILSFIGSKDIIIGDKEFDDRMYVTATNKDEIISLLNKKVRNDIFQLSKECELSISNTIFTAFIDYKKMVNPNTALHP